MTADRQEKTDSIELQESDEFEYVTIPPDGGFGWIVLLACFVSISDASDVDSVVIYFSSIETIGLIIDGFLYAFGAVSNDLKNYYQCKEWAVSLVISIACGCYWLIGKYYRLSYRRISQITFFYHQSTTRFCSV